jgi:hypothetical protein
LLQGEATFEGLHRGAMTVPEPGRLE